MYCFRGVKATLWEGGMRGTGFVYSPGLNKTSYISNHMMHVSDWLPTLYTVAGGNSSILGNVDGIDQWKSLSTNTKSLRSEILHNIDPLTPVSASLRVGDHKLITGDPGMKWSGWYPPWQAEKTLDISSNNLKSYSNVDILTEGENDWQTENQKVHVHCGKKPFNASTNCNPVSKPCLFNIAKDPCEYYNIAEDNQILVKQMLDRLEAYNRTMIAPGNQPEDPKGNPRFHNDTWVPWIIL